MATPLTVTNSVPLPDLMKQAKAALPQPEIKKPWEEEPELPSAAERLFDKVTAPVSDKVLKPFREGLDKMGADLEHAGERGYTQGGTALPPLAAKLVQGVGTTLRFVPVGSNVKETMAANLVPPELGPEGRAALKIKPTVHPSGFYSTLEHIANTKLPDKLSGEQLLGTLRNAGVSPKEIEHAEINELAKRGSLTKDEVRAHVKERVPHVETIQKGGPNKVTPKFQELSYKHAEMFEDMKASLRNELGLTDQDANYAIASTPNDTKKALKELGVGDEKAKAWMEQHSKDITDFRVLRQKIDDIRSTDENRFDSPKYESYTLPGGSNYREVLLQLPEKEIPWSKEKGARLRELEDVKKHGRYINGKTEYLTPAEEAERTKLDRDATERDNRSEPYSGPHFDEPNVVAHLRLKDRVDVNGKKTLFIEELQSDWARELRESKTPVEGDTPADAGMRAAREESRVPDMPFDKSWHELSLKKALDIAVKEGYDQVAWTTGEQQANRYNLRDYYKDLKLREEDGKLKLYATPAEGSKGGSFRSGYGIEVTKDNLSQYVGKDHAQNLLGQLDKGPVETPHIDKKTGEYFEKGRQASIDLSKNPIGMGGEHHLRLYDEMVPQFLGKHTKKWGGQVGETEINLPHKGPVGEKGWILAGNHKVQALPITPAMREGVKQGQPLLGSGLDFSAIPGHVAHETPRSSARIEGPRTQSKLEIKQGRSEAKLNLSKYVRAAGGVGGEGAHVVDQIIEETGQKPHVRMTDNGHAVGVKLPQDVELYHSTNPEAAQDIIKNGLKPSSWDHGKKHLSTNLGPRSLAEGFAELGDGQKEVLLKVKVPKGTRIYRDDIPNDPTHIRVFDAIPKENVEAVKGKQQLDFSSISGHIEQGGKQGGHAGGGVASEEELARPGRFVKVSRSGQLTDQGKTPDFNLKEGEAGYQVKPDGTYELKAGQETPATKRGVEGYVKLTGKKPPTDVTIRTELKDAKPSTIDFSPSSKRWKPTIGDFGISAKEVFGASVIEDFPQKVERLRKTLGFASSRNIPHTTKVIDPKELTIAQDYININNVKGMEAGKKAGQKFSNPKVVLSGGKMYLVDGTHTAAMQLRTSGKIKADIYDVSWESKDKLSGKVPLREK